MYADSLEELAVTQISHLLVNRACPIVIQSLKSNPNVDLLVTSIQYAESTPLLASVLRLVLTNPHISHQTHIGISFWRRTLVALAQ